jgi:murein DD-endopeptidase MepM/ murein hydrolase activator NlpD
VRKGERVVQGQVIGYVGSTGLSTGPHVCFRFWKNGVQVDHLAEDIPSAGPISAADRAAFEAFRDRCQLLLGPTGEEDCATSE